MKLYGHPWSTNSRKALLTFAEKGHEPDLVTIMLPKGEHKTPEHLARHPFGKVPVLEDDGFLLYETPVINRYLDRRLSGPRLTPEDPREAARMEQLMHVGDAYFLAPGQDLILELLFRKYLGGEPNTSAIAKGREAIQKPLDVIDETLGSTPYLAGKSFSLADIHWMPQLEYLHRVGEGESIARRRHLSAWWNRVSERPTWQKVARSGPQP
jgi:glutathione S-transferase